MSAAEEAQRVVAAWENEASLILEVHDRDELVARIVATITATEARANLMRDAMQEFCDRVDKGEVRSTYTYRKFKDILGQQPLEERA